MQDANLFYLGLELLIDGSLVGCVVWLARRYFPKISREAVKAGGFALFAIILMIFGVYGTPKMASAWQWLVRLTPHLAITVWSMLFFDLWLKVADLKKSINVSLEARDTRAPRAWTKIITTLAVIVVFCAVVIRITGASSSSRPKITITSQHENEIVRAVRGKWGYSEFQNMKTDNLPNNDYFLEYSHIGNPYDVILVREIDSPSVTSEISSKLKNANRYFADKESPFHHVDVVLTIYRNLELSEKVSLRQQMDIVKGSEPLGANVSFDLWDKTDLDKYGALVP